MSLNHEEYLNRVLASKKDELKNLNVSHRVAIAEYEAKQEMIKEQIDSIERQLGK